jgi:hypothetical protein
MIAVDLRQHVDEIDRSVTWSRPRKVVAQLVEEGVVRRDGGRPPQANGGDVLLLLEVLEVELRDVGRRDSRRR